MEATWISMDRWMDKKVVVHIHNGIWLSHKKEYIWVSSNEVDEPRPCYAEWSNSERRKTNTVYSCIYMESRKMVSVNLFAGKERKCSHLERICGRSGGRTERDKRRQDRRRMWAIVYKAESCGEAAVYRRETSLALCADLEGRQPVREALHV